MDNIKRILVTGAVGQIGSELTLALRGRYGADNVVAAGHHTQPSAALLNSGPYETLDVCQGDQIAAVIKKHNIDTIVHLAALLSAIGEKNPQLCWSVNVGGLYNVLELARDLKLNQVFCPSSIAVFGPETPRDRTPQETVMLPKTMYGVSKVSGELLCDYYHRRFGVDARGVRYPGIISSETLPGGGTTDYAVAIYYDAIKYGKYTCFLREDTVLPMMYMPDCLKGTMDLMEADGSRLKHRADFNMAAMSFSAGELAAEIGKHIPGFTVGYQPDFRQAIADSWPRSLDDSAARAEWDWRPSYDISSMTVDMLQKLGQRHQEGKL
jgi:nucleoside-diphosphate-sugar epimerase